MTPFLACLLALPGVVLGARADHRTTLLSAMEVELERSVAELRLDDHLPPYYISYRLVDRDSVVVEASFGAVVQDQRRKNREVSVDVRVGDYTFDSSPEPDDDVLFSEQSNFRPSHKAPVDDDPATLRATLWLLSDLAYKDALGTHLRKKARKVNKVQDKQVDSFSKEKAVKHLDPPLALEVDRARMARVARAVSARFRSDDGLVLGGTMRVTADRVRVYLVNSEGTRLVREHLIYAYAFDVAGRAPDGLLLQQGQTLYGRAWSELPDEAAVIKLADTALADLRALAAAPVADPYTGPAILEPEATGVFFHEAVGHRLEGERQNDDNEGQTFKGHVGAKILPDFVTVRDDPSMRAFAGVSLNGFYPFDDQGVASQNVVLVDKGVLRTFLTSRTPIEDLAHSNGHGRAQGVHRPMARMGNLIVEGANPVSRAELKVKLLEEVRNQGKPYGLIIRDITGGSTNTSGYGYQAFKGTPRMVYRVDAKTGAETLVRGVEMVGTPLTAVSKIVATSKEMGVFNGYCGAESGYVPVSTVAPATLFREIELQRTRRAKERAPLLPPPWKGKPSEKRHPWAPQSDRQ